MKRLRNLCTLLCISLCCASAAQAQYLNQLFDMDSTAEFAVDLYVQQDGKIVIYGGGLNLSNWNSQAEWMVVSPDGSTVLSKHVVSMFPMEFGGPYAKLQPLPDDGFVATFSKFAFLSYDTMRCFAGLIRVKADGDTAFMRTYTDTAVWTERTRDCTPMPDGGFLIAGDRQLNDAGFLFWHGMLIKTDSAGNFLWRATVPGSGVFSIQYLGGDTLLAGAFTLGYDVPTLEYTFKPLFMLLDTLGNVRYQRSYPTGYRGGSNIRKDMNGGYFHWGVKDSLTIPGDILDFRNFPGYLAHLDDSFRFTWTHVFYDTLQPKYHLFVQNVLQLSDSNYLVTGSILQIGGPGSYEAYVAKLSQGGNIVWEHKFHMDTGTFDCYLIDAVERPDKSLLLAGEARNAFAPEWRHQDFWLVGLDSNGCITAGCSPTGVVQLPPKEVGEVQVYPNPTTGAVIVSLPESGSLALVNVQGQQVAAFELNKGENHLRMPAGIAPGIYIGRLVLGTGKHVIIRIAYQP